ncbi:hypothetical protein AALO_G00144930 [Alosa alosa]|uniref:Uncharacterized protein n=1 Tax=Alosa alosa TaxID=278164 RepID=A0AAV6GN18_9TELE|nr:hypothetical protein AALO_G00144930 [Alosa alosa]
MAALRAKVTGCWKVIALLSVLSPRASLTSDGDLQLRLQRSTGPNTTVPLKQSNFLQHSAALSLAETERRRWRECESGRERTPEPLEWSTWMGFTHTEIIKHE